ncbi:MAG: RNA 2',3'-cyclic phosphodiesterase [Anaerolineae bacterium]
MSTLRTFIAIELDGGLKEDLARLQDHLQAEMPPRSVRWVRPEGIHLTLKFLGDTTPGQVEQVKEALARVAAGAGPITFGLGGVGCFPHTRRPRVVWVGLHEPTGDLAHLRDAVEAHVAPLGFPTEKRPFSPHLTLGRVQRHASNAEVRQVGEAVAASAIGDIGEMTATGLSYIRSKLTPGGAVYTTLARLELTAK